MGQVSGGQRRLCNPVIHPSPIENLRVFLRQFRVRQVSVTLRGGDTFVPDKLLRQFQIPAGGE